MGCYRSRTELRYKYTTLKRRCQEFEVKILIFFLSGGCNRVTRVTGVCVVCYAVTNEQ